MQRIIGNVKSILRGRRIVSKMQFSSAVKESDRDDTPIKYLASKARDYEAKSSRIGKQDRLWYEPHTIFISLYVFLLYFAVIREENDIDEELNRTLFSRISGMEEQQLKLVLKYNQEHNIDSQAIVTKLEQLASSKGNS